MGVNPHDVVVIRHEYIEMPPALVASAISACMPADR